MLENINYSLNKIKVSKFACVKDRTACLSSHAFLHEASSESQ